MTVVAIFSGSFCGAEDVARAVARILQTDLVDDETLHQVAPQFGLSGQKLARVTQGPPPFLNRLTHEHEKGLARLRATMAVLVQRDAAVYHGFAGHLIPPGIGHVLRVCLIANFEDRVQVATRDGQVSEREAVRKIRTDDRARFRWTQGLHGADPYSASLYDAVWAMHLTTPEEAAGEIASLARREDLQPTRASRQAAADFALAADVEIALVEKEQDLEITADAGAVTIAVNRYTARMDALKQRLESLASQVPGVKSVRCLPGPGFVPPSLLVSPDDVGPPPKILLVDDEREFVHTLSERLQSRNLASAVVYDGEEALSFVESDEPEVMVLDLKMPGIDGIEVLRRVKRDHPNVEVIILTGHGSREEQEVAEELGAFAYLRKPVDIDLLTATMRAAYQRVAGRMEGPPGGAGD